MKAFACKPLKLSSNKVLVLGSIKGAKEPFLVISKEFEELFNYFKRLAKMPVLSHKVFRL